MGYVSGNYSLARGAEIEIVVSDSTGKRSETVSFLIDTGAQMSRIPEALAERLQLEALGLVLTSSPTSAAIKMKSWAGKLAIPAIGFVSSTMQIGEFVEGPHVKALLGRDLMHRMCLSCCGRSMTYQLAYDEEHDLDPLIRDDDAYLGSNGLVDGF